MLVEKYSLNNYEEWDSFISESSHGNFLHTRKFLNYHRERFRDFSFLVRAELGEVIAVFPAALIAEDSRDVVSHPGSTFGGLVFKDKVLIDTRIDAYRMILDELKRMKINSLSVRVVPSFYEEELDDLDDFVMHHVGFQVTSFNLSSTIKLNGNLEYSNRRVRGMKKGSSRLVLGSGIEYLEPFYEVLLENLRSVHNVSPVHSLKELEELMKLFEEEIELDVALFEQKVCAGIVKFSHDKVVHAQYIAANEIGRSNSALDYLFSEGINAARSEKKEYFDFGISTIDSGRHLNLGLHNYKMEFGSVPTLYKTFSINF